MRRQTKYEWMKYSMYNDFKWVSSNVASETMTKVDAIMESYVAKNKHFLKKAIPARRTSLMSKPLMTSDVYLQLQEIFDGKFERIVLASSGNDRCSKKVPFVMISYLSQVSGEERYFIKVGVITILGEYIRTADIEFDPNERSPGSAATQYIKQVV